MPAVLSRIRLSRCWATLLVVAAAVVVGFAPGWHDTLLYRRVEIAGGQWWRLWTGHLVHFGWRHLLADVAVLGAAGAWLESFAPRTARAFLLIAPLAISAFLYAADPRLTFYGGLSGLAIGLLVLLALVQVRRDRGAQPWLWPAVLGLVALKVALEAFTDTPLVASFSGSVKVSTLAHVGGIAGAFLAWPWARRESA